MMGLSPFGKKSYVGIDLGHYEIKAVQVEKSGAGWKVVRFGAISTPADSIKEAVVIDAESVGAAIKHLLRESHISANYANVAVSGGAVVVRTVRIPKMAEATLRKSIKYEASRYVPSSVEDSYIEFEILGDADEGQMDVLIVAAPKEIVESRIKACQLAGLEVEAVDVEPFAAHRSLIETDQSGAFVDQTVALIDIGSSMTSMSVVRNGVFAMTRAIPNGGETMTSALKSYFKLSDADAESGKSQLDVAELLDEQPKENPPLRIVQPHIDDLVREIRRSLNYYQSQQNDSTPGGKTVNSLVLCGGTAGMPGLTKYLSTKLGMPAVDAGIYDNPRFTNAGHSAGRGLELAVASGLAMRAFAKAA